MIRNSFSLILIFLVSLGAACKDSTFRFKYNSKFKNCDFIARKNTELRCEFYGVKTHCPETCNSCNICTDSPLRFKIVSKASSFVRSCMWVGNQDTATRCEIHGVKFECPVTCGLDCKSNCEDRAGRFEIVTSIDRVFARNCDWVKKKDTTNRCNIKGVAELCPQTCGICA